MKKSFIALLLVFSLIFLFTACAGNGDSVLETADSTINVTDDAGTVSLNDETARMLLGAYGKEVLNLEKDLSEYTLRLSAGTIPALGSEACIVEAFEGEAEQPAGKYAIIGYNCFIFDNESSEYLIMTKNGAVPVSVNTDESETAEDGSDFIYDVNNHNVLLEKFKKYSATQLGTEKEITEYILTAEGNTSTSADGKTVYTVFVYEKDGTRTDCLLAFNEDGVFAKNEDGVFEKLG